MQPGRLSRLQSEVLSALAGFEPPWTLTGGAALSGFHTGHRTTRDLDLFWRERSSVAEFAEDVTGRLLQRGFDVSMLQSGRSFLRLLVRDRSESTVLDLVADPVANVTEPDRVDLGGRMIGIDSKHEILVNKLVAVLGRSELRDLEDIRVLLEAGGDLSTAVRDAGCKDGGFSVMTLAWILRGFEIEKLARSSDWDARRVELLGHFRDELVLRLADLARA